MNLLVCQFLSVVLKVFGFAWVNLLGSLSALAKQERMLVINDISGALAVSHAVTPTYHRAHNRDNGISVKRAFMQHTTTARVIFPAIRTDCSFSMKIRHLRGCFIFRKKNKSLRPQKVSFSWPFIYIKMWSKKYFILLQMEQQGGGVSVQGHSWDAKCQ